MEYTGLLGTVAVFSSQFGTKKDSLRSIKQELLITRYAATYHLKRIPAAELGRLVNRSKLVLNVLNVPDSVS